MLMLPPPSRRVNDVAISLRAPAGCNTTAEAMANVARLCNCPPHIAERVRACILHSGRYDCRIAVTAAYYLVHKPDLLRPFSGEMRFDADDPASEIFI